MRPRVSFTCSSSSSTPSSRSEQHSRRPVDELAGDALAGDGLQPAHVLGGLGFRASPSMAAAGPDRTSMAYLSRTVGDEVDDEALMPMWI